MTWYYILLACLPSNGYCQEHISPNFYNYTACIEAVNKLQNEFKNEGWVIGRLDCPKGNSPEGSA